MTSTATLENFATASGSGARRTAHLLTFEVAGRDMALEAAEVREVLQPVALSPMPQAGPMVEGAMNVRGEVVLVFDLRRLLGLEKRRWTRKTRIIVAQSPAAKVGLIIDTVLDVLEVPEGELSPRPETTLGINSSAVVAVLRSGERLVPVLSVANLVRAMDETRSSVTKS